MVVKIKPSMTVIVIPIWVSNHDEFNNDICAHVIVAPLESNNVVFNRGTSYGLIAFTPAGGQRVPVSIFGLREEWKKAQKNARKKKISLIMKRHIPKRIPSSTLRECFPWSVASRLTSRNHCLLLWRRIKKPRMTR